ncbi:hypothetical protein A3D78_02965 [Candidatus Gottesmanbacteria bacterium RIFCSPHIGHO2_02_FULL_39_14]|uniref:CBS domain-containing protein n=2 Tax=Candidatus Gottesmaniibacteriota TaxID=1752720 RepID=A0A1F5ZU25_9BACT|nr:MAG: hypothetical protein A3D78_02965 [Candidatus Gottesmanbacteria bacterium RIFCSPHIGHO2_02_FULL_39_14]OGG30883.1 MAG: hypothetical protein A3I51_03830 [Candidatus Gottesmanbacteria bacterium RIFCSPLOWO2_02_FULL_38_8]
MLYISEILGKDVINERNLSLGKVSDVLFLYAEVPNVTKIRVASEKKDVLIAISDIKKINQQIFVSKHFKEGSREENEASIKENLLDRQVIDLVGNKVVRVNDVVVADKPNFYISGIDISFWGVLRRLHLLSTVIRAIRFLRLPPVRFSFLSWGDIHNLEFDLGQIKLKSREEKLNRIHPEDLADHLQTTNIGNIKKFIQTLDTEKAAEVFGGLSLVHQTAVINELNPQSAAVLMQNLDPDEATDILLALNRRKRELIISLLPEKEQKELTKLIGLSTTSMGELLTTEYLAVDSKSTAREIVEHLRRETGDFSCLHAIYVLNEKKQLTGVFSLHELLMQSSETPAYKFMIAEPLVLTLSTPLELAAKKMIRYKFSALPVVDTEKKLVGIVTIDDLSDYLLDRL